MENNKSIIHVLYNCYWGDGMSGGDRRIIEILRRWKKSNIEFILYTSNSFKKLLEEEQVRDIKYLLTDDGCDEKTGLIQTYMIRTSNCKKLLLENIKEGECIYSPTDILPDITPAYCAKKKYGNIVRWTMISYHIYETFYKRPGNIIRNYISCTQQQMALNKGKRLADAILTTSPLVVDYLKSKKFDINRVVIVDNAVDNGLIDKCNLDVSGYDAVFLARLNNSKGVMELPAIWETVIKSKPDARLALIGKGSPDMIEKLNNKIDECGVQNRVDVLGYLDPDKAYSIMKHSKIFLFTSHEEGWGMALAEAQLCGLAVVAYDLPIYSKLFKGLKLCPMLDIDAMAEGVIEYLDDEVYLKEMAERGKEHILANYSLDVVADREYKAVIG